MRVANCGMRYRNCVMEYPRLFHRYYIDSAVNHDVTYVNFYNIYMYLCK